MGCQLDMTSGHLKTQHQSGLKRWELKMRFEESLLKSIVKVIGAGRPAREESVDRKEEGGSSSLWEETYI